MKALLISLGLAVCATSAFADLELAKKKNCMACHALDKKVVGPSYKDVAAKFAKDKNAVKELSDRIQHGSKGVWGPVPMPPNANVSPAEAETLAKWVLTVK